MAMLTPSLILSLVVLCAICICQSSADPFTVSDIQYYAHNCYDCSTVVDDNDQVDTSKAAADSKFCIATNRELLRHGSQNVSSCALGEVCTAFVSRLGTTDVYASRPAEGWRFQVVRRCARWNRGDAIAAGDAENCSPRLTTPDGKSLFIRCYCETNECNDWTYTSLKRRFYDMETGLMPAMYTTEDYPTDTSLLRINTEAKSIENELCFKCSTYFRQAGTIDLTPLYGISNPPCLMRYKEDAQDLMALPDARETCQYSWDPETTTGQRCGTELTHIYDDMYELKRGCLSIKMMRKRFWGPNNYFQWEPAILHPGWWLFFENACSRKVTEQGSRIQDCVCSFHWCNEWSLSALWWHFDNPIFQLNNQGSYSRPPPASSTAITSTSPTTATTTAATTTAVTTTAATTTVATTTTNVEETTLPIAMVALDTDNITGSFANLSASALDVASAARQSAPHPIYLLVSSCLAVLALLHAV